MATTIEIKPVEVTSISLTSAAAEVVRGLLKERNLDESYGLRVYVTGRSCSGYQYGMGLENKPGESDTLFESEGLKVIIDEVSMQYMSGSVVDFIDDERGKGFMVENPNAVTSCNCEGEGGGCGCGSSEN